MNPKKMIIIVLLVVVFFLAGFIIYEKFEEAAMVNELNLYQKGYDDGITDTVKTVFEQTENCGVSELAIFNQTKQVLDLSCFGTLTP